MTKHIRSSFGLTLLSTFALLAPAPSAHATTSCEIHREVEELSVVYNPAGPWTLEAYQIDFRVRYFGTNPCGDPFDFSWPVSWTKFGDSNRPCGQALLEQHQIDVWGSDDLCASCWIPELLDFDWICCDMPASERFLTLELDWPRLRTTNWNISGSQDVNDPACEYLQISYFDAAGRGVRFVGSAYVDGVLGDSIDLSVNSEDNFAEDLLCVDAVECALVAGAIDVFEQCDGVNMLKTEGMVISYEGENCRDIWLSRSNPGCRAIHRTGIDGNSGPVTMARALPAEFESGRWTVAYQASGLTELLADGPQPSGSVVAGSETGELSIAAATAADLGVYTFWGIPPGGTMDDAVSLDSMRLVSDVGQPEFASEPAPASAWNSMPATFTADAPDATGFIWRIADRIVPMGAQWLEVRGYSLEVGRPSPDELLVRPVYLQPHSVPEELTITCEAWNDAGGVVSYEVPLRVQSLAAVCYLSYQGPPALGVWTQSATGANVYTVVIETSDDLGATWNVPEVSTIQHTEPGQLSTAVPVSLTHPCAGFTLVRAQVFDDVGTVASMPPMLRAPQLVLADCSPDDMNQTDFRCVTCPAQVDVTLDAGEGETNEPFTVLRSLPAGNWAVRWVLQRNSNSLAPPIPLSDGAATHSTAFISGSATPALTVSNPSWDDLGTYSMLVRNLDDATAREFCADMVTVRWGCGIPVSQNPASVRVCPDLTEFTVEALSDDPAAVMVLLLDGFIELPSDQGFNQPIEYAWDDPFGVGEEVSFTFTWESNTRWRITNYSASATHTLTGSMRSTNCWTAARTNEAVLWDMPADECATCGSDLDGSGEVDFGDVAIVLLDYGPCDGCATDADGTAEVDFGDVALVLLDFGPCR